MPEQDACPPDRTPVEEEYADNDEQVQEEEHASTKNESIPRSSFFFACLSFLIAFICQGLWKKK